MEKRIYIVATEDAYGWLTDFTISEVENWDDERFIAEAEAQGFVWTDMESFMRSWNDTSWIIPDAGGSVMRIL